MNFLIDYDTLSVECKSEDADVLQQYISDNDLGLALAIVSEEDDMLMEMSLKEISGLYHKLSDRPRKFELEEEAVKATFALLEDTDEEYPVFTPALGKALLKAAAKRSKDKGDTTLAPAKKDPVKPKQAGKTTTKRKTSYAGKDFTVGTKEPTRGRHSRLVAFIEDNLGEASAEELELFLEGEKGGPTPHINYAIKKGFIEET